MRARLAARPIACVMRELALIAESLREAAAEHGVSGPRVVLVVTVGFAREDRVQTVMYIVIPLCVTSLDRAGRAEEARLIRRILEYQVHMPLGARAAPH